MTFWKFGAFFELRHSGNHGKLVGGTHEPLSMFFLLLILDVSQIGNHSMWAVSFMLMDGDAHDHLDNLKDH